MGKTIYKTFLLVVLVVTVAFAFIVVGNIITIGNKIGIVVHPYMEYAFYIIIILLSVVFIVIPIIRVALMPPLPELDIHENDSTNKIKKLAKQLINSCGYIENKNEEKEHCQRLKVDIEGATETNQLVKIIESELNIRFNKARKEIRQAAVCSFASTAISQNSTIDSLSILMINCKLIHKIIQSLGFRPSVSQTIKIYVNVIFSVFFAHISQAGIEQGATIVINQFIKGLKSVPFSDVIVGSVIDGSVNALMTLRVGYLTLSYLKKGAKSQISEEDKKNAAINAIKTLPDAIGSKAIFVVDFVTKFFKKEESGSANIEIKEEVLEKKNSFKDLLSSVKR